MKTFWKFQTLQNSAVHFWAEGRISSLFLMLISLLLQCNLTFSILMKAHFDLDPLYRQALFSFLFLLMMYIAMNFTAESLLCLGFHRCPISSFHLFTWSGWVRLRIRSEYDHLCYEPLLGDLETLFLVTNLKNQLVTWDPFYTVCGTLINFIVIDVE